MSYTGALPPWEAELNQESEIETNVNDIQTLKTDVSSLQAQVDSLGTATTGGGFQVDQHLDTSSDVKFHSVAITEMDTLTTGLNHLIISPNRGVSSNDFVSISNSGTVSLKELKSTVDGMATEVKTNKVLFDNNCSVNAVGNILHVTAPQVNVEGLLSADRLETKEHGDVDQTLTDLHDDISVALTDLVDIKNHHQPNKISPSGEAKFVQVSLLDTKTSQYYDLDTKVRQNESNISSSVTSVASLQTTVNTLSIKHSIQNIVVESIPKSNPFGGGSFTSILTVLNPIEGHWGSDIFLKKNPVLRINQDGLRYDFNVTVYDYEQKSTSAYSFQHTSVANQNIYLNPSNVYQSMNFPDDAPYKVSLFLSSSTVQYGSYQITWFVARQYVTCKMEKLV